MEAAQGGYSVVQVTPGGVCSLEPGSAIEAPLLTC